MSDETTAIIDVNLKYMKLKSVHGYTQSLKTTLVAQSAVTSAVDVIELIALIDELHSAMVAKQGFTQTSRIDLADRFRDTILSAINLYLRAEALMPSEIQADAQALLHTLQEFGVSKLRGAKHGDETALIRSFITRLNTGDNAARLAKFPKLEDWTTTLEEANNEVESIMEEKYDEIEQDLDFTSASKIRQQLIPVYEAVVAKINAHALIGTAPEFAAIVSAINAIIIGNQYN